MDPKLNSACYAVLLLSILAQVFMSLSSPTVPITPPEQLDIWSRSQIPNSDPSVNVTSEAKRYRRRQGSALTLTEYTAIVVFGASYCDNAHDRPAEYKDSLRGSPYWKGRYTNGPVFSEHLASGILTGKKITHLNYAYGGAAVNNALTGGTVPDTATQTSSYIDDVAYNRVVRTDADKGRALHIFWIGINDVIQIWKDAIANGALAQLQSDSAIGGITNQADQELQQANQRIDDQVKTLMSQVGAIRDDASVNEVASDILILTLPPLETVPNLYYESLQLASRNPSPVVDNESLDETYLTYVGQLTARYNDGIIKGTNDLAAQATSTAPVLATSRPLFVKTFDIVTFWNYVREGPSGVGFKDVSKACWNSSTGKICPRPDTFEYWDTLHPTTAMHKLVAQQLTTACNT